MTHEFRLVALTGTSREETYAIFDVGRVDVVRYAAIHGDCLTVGMLVGVVYAGTDEYSIRPDVQQ